jgi:hypothetical protein
VQDLEQALVDFTVAIEQGPEATDAYRNRAYTQHMLTKAMASESEFSETQEGTAALLNSLVKTEADSMQVIDRYPFDIWARILHLQASMLLSDSSEDEVAAARWETLADEDGEALEELVPPFAWDELISTLTYSGWEHSILPWSLSVPPSDYLSVLLRQTLGEIRGSWYTSPDSGFRLRMPDLIAPRPVIWDEVAASGDFLVFFSDDLGRWFTMQVHPGTLGGQPLEEWVHANIAEGLDVQEQYETETQYGQSIVFFYRHAEQTANCGMTVVHHGERFYSANYCLLDSTPGLEMSRGWSGGYGIAYEPVDALTEEFLEGLEILSDSGSGSP